MLLSNFIFTFLKYLKSNFIDFIIVFISIIPLYLTFNSYSSGDAAIYFSFIKYFFSYPFSFYNEVSFGATSPLYVIVHAFSYLFAGESCWITVSIILNFLFIILGIILIFRALSTNYLVLFLIVLGTILNKAIFINTAQLYETSFAFFVISLLYYFLKKQYYHYVIIIAGILYLVRPEFILLSIIIYAYLKNKIYKPLFWISISVLPVIVYHFFMFIHTNDVIPSNVVAKMVRGSESNLSWLDHFLSSLASINYIMIVLVTIMILINRNRSKYKTELLLIVPIPIIYTLFPSSNDLTRYLLPIYPVLLSSIMLLVIDYFDFYFSKLATNKILSLSFFLYIFTVIIVNKYYYMTYYFSPHFNYDTVLLKDLSDRINPFLTANDKILIYEIQGQYNIKSFCYSLDGIVGNHIHNVLVGKESFDNFIISHRINYIVTMNSLNYRKVFKNTLMERLYTHDLNGNVGDTLIIDKLKFKKKLSNEVFYNPNLFSDKNLSGLNVGRSIRVYRAGENKVAGISPFWNSVYEVLY